MEEKPMTPRLRLTRLPAVAVVLSFHLLATQASLAQTAESILQKSRDTYGQLKSYADTGVVLYEYGTTSEDKHTFSTAFNRAPRHVLLDFHKQGGDRYVIWADPDAFHTWWKATGQKTDYPNPNNTGALSLSAPQTSGLALKIPTLLYGKAFESAMLKMKDPGLAGAEDVEGHRCHRISGRASDVYGATGREVNIHQVTAWIDAESFLVRKMAEEFSAPPGQRNRVITTFEPQTNPTLDEAKFKFAPPAS
jgi:outer membrane lipoprotein-sorting protein